MSWNDGYRTDLTYTYGYYNEINPACMRFVLLMAGLVPPDVNSACELGYGQGISLNIHAAAETVKWWGTDFNPSQAAFAREMAQISGAHCLAESFQNLVSIPDLPEFEYIALHGIWSWISPQNRDAIVRFIDKKLAVGGVVYISYNTSPGWYPFRPLRDLMKLHVDTHGGTGTSVLDRISNAMEFAQKFIELKPGYVNAYPAAGKRMEFFTDKDAHYLAHELFNDDWETTSFAEMNAALGEARLSLASSASPLGVIPGLGLSAEQRAFVNDLKDPVLAESVMDFIYNTQFRKDYWIKGPRRLSGVARNSALRDEQFILLAPMTDIGRQIKTNMGDITISEGAHAVITQVMKDGKIHSAAELEKMSQQLAARETAPKGMEAENLQALLHAMLVLIAGGLAAPVQKKAEITKARPVTDKLNFLLCQRAIDSGDIAFLASPVTGGGIRVSRFYQLFLLAIKRGARSPEVMAAFARDCLSAANQYVVVEGKTITDPHETLQYLQNQAETFMTASLPLLKNLQVVQA